MAAGSGPAGMRPSNLTDPSTLSNFLDVRVTRMDLDLAVDFDAKVIRGTVTYTATVESEAGASELILDTHHLSITRVTSDGELVCSSRGFRAVNSPPSIVVVYESICHPCVCRSKVH